MEERWKCPAKRGRKVHREKARQSRQHKNDMLFAFLRAFCVAGIVVAARAAGLGGWIGAKKLPVCAPRCRERPVLGGIGLFPAAAHAPKRPAGAEGCFSQRCPVPAFSRSHCVRRLAGPKLGGYGPPNGGAAL